MRANASVSNDPTLPSDEAKVEQLRKALEDVLDEINKTVWRDGCGFSLSDRAPPIARARGVLAAFARGQAGTS